MNRHPLRSLAGWSAGAMVAALLVATATVRAQDGFIDLGLHGAEGFEALEFDANSRPATHALTTAVIYDGLVTVDPRNGSTATVVPDVSTDARGIVSGILTVTLSSASDSSEVSRELPAVGRARLAVHTVAEAPPLEGVAPASEEDPQVHVRQMILLLGRSFVSIERSFYVALVADSFPRLHIDGLLPLHDRRAVDSPDLHGALAVAVGLRHGAKSRISLEPFDPVFASFLISEDSVTSDTVRGVVKGDAVVESDSLGTIEGGHSLLRFLYNNPSTAHTHSGLYRIQAVTHRFRYHEAGLLGTTLEEALAAGGDPEAILANSSPRAILMTTPSAFNVTRFRAAATEGVVRSRRF